MAVEVFFLIVTLTPGPRNEYLYEPCPRAPGFAQLRRRCQRLPTASENVRTRTAPPITSSSGHVGGGGNILRQAATVNL